MVITKQQFINILHDLKILFGKHNNQINGIAKVIKQTKGLDIIEIRTPDVIMEISDSNNYFHRALINCHNYNIKAENNELIITLEFKTNRKQLHNELHELKRKIELCKFNNQNYKRYEKRFDEINKELGYPIKDSKPQKRSPNSLYREAPSKRIKVYLGGR